MPRRLTFALAALLLGAMLVLVWPTAYREYRLGNTTARVNRFTGRTDVLRPWGWERQAPPPR